MQNITWKTVHDQLCKGVALMLILSLLSNLAALALPIYTLQIFDRVLQSNSQETLVMLFIALGIMGIAYLGFDALRQRIPHLLSDTIETQLTNPLLLNAVNNKHDKKTAHQPPIWLSITELRKLIRSPVILAALDVVWSPLFIALLFFIHPWFGCLLLIANTLFLLITIARYYMLKKHHHKQHQLQQTVHQQNSLLLKTQLTMSSMGMAQHWLNETEKHRDKLYEVQQYKDNLAQRFSQLTQSCRWLLQAGLPTVGALLLMTQTITAGAMIAALIIGTRAIVPFEVLAQNWHAVNKIKHILQRIKQALDQKNGPQTHTPPLKLTGHIRVNDLSISRHDDSGNKSNILENVNFSLMPGQTLAIIGPNGVGKSILIQTLLAQYQQKLGDILLDKSNLDNLDKFWLGQQVGYIPQYLQIPEAKVNAIICRHQPVDRKKLIAASEKANISDMILALPNGYDTIIGGNNYPGSPGVTQRIALARALYGSPQYLFFDEADAFLDHKGMTAYQQAISAQKKAGKTIIFITQRRSNLALADYILLLDEGRQTFYGTPQQMDNLFVTKSNHQRVAL